MNENQKRFAVKLGGVAANSFVGGVVFALVAALLLGIGGGFVGWLMPETIEVKRLYLDFGVRIGVVTGIFSGAIGALIFAVAATKTKSLGYFSALQRSVVRIVSGQIVGILSAVLALTLFENYRAYQQEISFSAQLRSDDFSIFFVSVASMILGAIAGALWKRAEAKR